MTKIDITLNPSEVAALKERTPLENVALYVISQVFDSLPNNRDWLDPELEKFGKKLLAKAGYTPGPTPLEVELLAALKSLVSVASEAFDAWDSDNDMRCGKILRALSDPKVKGYRSDIDAAHAVIAKAESR